MDTDELSPVSEITILPDGRVYVFGATRPVLEVLELLRGPNGGQDERVRKLLHTLREQDLRAEDRST